MRPYVVAIERSEVMGGVGSVGCGVAEERGLMS